VSSMGRLKLAKKKTVNWRDIGLLTLAAFAWSKLGVGETVKDIYGRTQKPSCPPGQDAYILPGRDDYTCMTYEEFQRLSKAIRE